MGERERRFDPLEPERAELERTEERRCGAHRMEGRAQVVDETGKGELRRAAAAADRVVRFDDGDRATVSRQLDRG